MLGDSLTVVNERVLVTRTKYSQGRLNSSKWFVNPKHDIDSILNFIQQLINWYANGGDRKIWLTVSCCLMLLRTSRLKFKASVAKLNEFGLKFISRKVVHWDIPVVSWIFISAVRLNCICCVFVISECLRAKSHLLYMSIAVFPSFVTENCPWDIKLWQRCPVRRRLWMCLGCFGFVFFP